MMLTIHPSRSRRFRRVSQVMLLWMVAALLSASSVRGQCQYSVTVLPEIDCFLGGPPEPVAINNLGHVIAYYDCGAGQRAALWTGTQWQTLPLPAGFDAARPFGLNDLDEVVGQAVDTVLAGGGATIDYTYACLWRPGQPAQLLGIPAGGNYSIATGINRHSEICGYWGNSDFGNPGLRAFIWRDGMMADLVLPLGPNSVANAIADSGAITGWMGAADTADAHAWVWNEEKTIDLGVIPGGISAQGVGIGPLGVVAGWGYTESDIPFGRRALIWRHGVPTLIPALQGLERCVARSTNGFATVGYCDNYIAPGNGGFLYQDGITFDLKDLISGANVLSATAINRQGVIVATGLLKGRHSTFVLSPIASNVADVTRNCVVNVDDLLATISEWGNTNSFADIDASGDVNVLDVLMVIENWGR